MDAYLKSYSQLALFSLLLFDLLSLLEGLTRNIFGHVNSFAVEQIFNRQNLDVRIILLPQVAVPWLQSLLIGLFDQVHYSIQFGQIREISFHSASSVMPNF